MRAERIEHSAHRVAYWPMTDQTLRKCRVVMSCLMQCESSFTVELACSIALHSYILTKFEQYVIDLCL